MLEEKILDIVRRKVALAVSAQEQLLEVQIGKIRADAASRGMLNSSHTVLFVDQACVAAMDERGKFVWYTLYRCITDTGVAYAPGLGEALKQAVTNLLPKDGNGLARRGEEMAVALGLQNMELYSRDTVSKAREAVLAHVFTEIDLFVLTLEKAAPKPEYHPQQVFNMQGATIGAVQSGAHSSASVTMPVGSAVSDLLTAFQSLKQALLDSSGISEDQKIEVIELVDDSVSLLGREKPNKAKLAAYVEGISNTLNGVAGLASAVPPAIEAVRAAYGAIFGG